MVATRLICAQIDRGIRRPRPVAENLTPITSTRRDGFMFSDDRVDWIEYDKRQFRQILGRLTRVFTATLDPHLARYPDDEWAQLATAQLTGVRATLDSRGYDAAKKINGRKRHITVDTFGLPVDHGDAHRHPGPRRRPRRVLAPASHPAAEYPGLGRPRLCRRTRGLGPRPALAEPVHRLPAQGTKGFVVLPRQWKVERTTGWCMNARRNSRDYERLPQHSEHT
ncbi:hypothetical protein ACIQJT_35380 [Streptomyces sp. NPDC091972]|uniref:hypothetical protein n=1 Tax=Streptomyces sp. NPDC091972 TaxID=3366007 RepID=UPI0038137E73